MNRLNQIICLIVTFITYNLMFYSIYKLIDFLSNIQSSSKVLYLIHHTKLDNEALYVIESLVKNTGLTALFIIPHSILPKLKQYFITDFELNVLGRTIYVLITSLSLILLVHFWSPVYSSHIWAINASDGLSWWIFALTHATSWIFLYGGVILMDIAELLGIKQVYYSIKCWKPPMEYKSKHLNSWYQHMRHPGIISLTIILWATPVLTLDRLQLALTWTSWMMFAWKTDIKDIEYLVTQLNQKKVELTKRKSLSTSMTQ